MIKLKTVSVVQSPFHGHDLHLANLLIRFDLLSQNSGGISSKLPEPEHALIHWQCLDFLCIWNTRNIRTHEFSSFPYTSNKNHVYN